MTLFDLLQPNATDGGGGVTIPLAWLLPLVGTGIVAAFTAGRVLLTRIERQYLAQIADVKASCDRTIAERDRQIERLEAREDEARKNIDTTITVLRQSVATQERTADALEAMVDRDKVPTRTRAKTGG